MQTTTVSELFSVFDQSVRLIREHRHISYLEALCTAGEIIFKGTAQDEELGKKLEPFYTDFYREGMTAEEIRRAFQLAALKGMKAEPRPGREMTPDSLVILMGHVVALLAGSRPFSILDPAVGTANLLTGVMNQAETDHIAAYGAETDDLMLKLAFTNANLQQKEIHFFHQDGLGPIYSGPVDFVVCDVPVGIYPDRQSAKSFELNGINGKAYTHFLFIEKGLRQLKESGYLFYLIPNQLFSEDKKHLFHRFIQKNAAILALLQLPSSLFKNAAAAKSVILLQKKGRGASVPKQTLLAEMPDFSDERKMRDFMIQMDQWFAR
ncbi:class I SAM-dependent methyltransferase [Sporolactobacillus sp. CQH2019]|uniref:class I SAM-dependent methyltransferase n=1 Tax=Sporolactobacillus sp. CQH2019 TaxID=3023512 RepID=UPI0023688097|nr:class I SAM-dependent methyltransferase [Sporolactobacillus sp. CQH2019]MDD9149519.1 class I SAM-dependent methyltransferase [Sporolactobacillus sp. CQH2019]